MKTELFRDFHCWVGTWNLSMFWSMTHNRWLSIAHKWRSIDILETEFLKFLNQQKMMPMITDETTVLYLKKHVKINSKEKTLNGNSVYWWLTETSLGGGVRGTGCVLCKINKNVIRFNASNCTFSVHQFFVLIQENFAWFTWTCCKCYAFCICLRWLTQTLVRKISGPWTSLPLSNR